MASDPPEIHRATRSDVFTKWHGFALLCLILYCALAAYCVFTFED